MNITPDKLSFIQKSLDMGEFDVVVKECCTLFEIALKKIFHEAMISLPFQDRIDIQESERKIGKNSKGVQEFTFGEIVGLFRESKLMSKWAKHSSRDIGLLNSVDFAPIVNLRNQITHEGAKCSRYEAELVHNFLRNLLATLGYADLKTQFRGTIAEKSPIDNNESKAKEDNIKVFNYLPDRGLIVNPSDGSRNVSFKVDTFNKIFDTIFREIAKISDEKTAHNILLNAGYESGKTFGAVVNNKWEVEENIANIHDKITKWCEFDSDVGWGKFINNLEIDEDSGQINGAILISENFQNYNRGKKDSLICSFIRGYCEGVIEELIGGLPVETECVMNMCPRSNVFKKKCNLLIKLKGELA